MVVGIIQNETSNDNKIAEVMLHIMPDDKNNVFLTLIFGKTLLGYIATIHSENKTKDTTLCKSSNTFSSATKFLAQKAGVDIDNLFENLNTVLNYLSEPKNMDYIIANKSLFVKQISSELEKVSANTKYTHCKYDSYIRFKNAIIESQKILDKNNENQPTQPIEAQNEVLHLVDIMIPFINMIHDSIFREMINKALKKKWLTKSCYASHFKDISKSLASFLQKIKSYEYFNKLSNAQIEKYRTIFLKLKEIDDSVKSDVVKLTATIESKLDSTQCTITDQFILDLKKSALQPLSLTKENVLAQPSRYDLIARESDITTTESDMSLPDYENDINRISMSHDAINSINIDTENIIHYIDSVTASIGPNPQGGKLYRRRTHHKKQTFRKRKSHRKQTHRKHK